MLDFERGDAAGLGMILGRLDRGAEEEFLDHQHTSARSRPARAATALQKAAHRWVCRWTRRPPTLSWVAVSVVAVEEPRGAGCCWATAPLADYCVTTSVLLVEEVLLLFFAVSFTS